MNKSNQDYKEKLVEIETQAKLGDSEVVPLRYQVQRLTSEMDSISTHAQWLEGELKAKNEQLASLRTTNASEMALLRSDYDAAVSAKESLNGETIHLRNQIEESQRKMEQIAKELRDSRQEASDSNLVMEQELIASQRLVNLQKEQMERLQQRHDTVAREMEALQKLAKQAEIDGKNELQERERTLETKTKKILDDQAKDYQRQVADLKEEVEEANRRCKKAEDGLLLTSAPSRRFTPRKQLAIKDKAEGEDDEPMNLTEIYARLAEAQDELNSETLRRKKAEIRVSRIEAEIEANAPLLVRQRQEYEMAMERQQDYKKRLQEALAESQAARGETSDLQGEMGRLQKRNRELEDEVTEMAKQVQTLLVSRSGTMVTDESTEIPTSVEEMQSANQRLMREHRRLTSTISELETKLKSDTLHHKVEGYEKELVTLREDRTRQKTMVESIVQQRDLYRALCHKQDSSLLGSSSDEASALQIIQQQSRRSNELEQKTFQLEADLAKARADLAAVGRDEEVASERLARYETLNAELTSAVDHLQLQVSSSKADFARSEADAAYHREKSVRLEGTLQRSRDEVARLSASKSGLEKINSDLQAAVTKANADASKFEGESQQVSLSEGGKRDFLQRLIDFLKTFHTFYRLR